jgi:hypothetical protein
LAKKDVEKNPPKDDKKRIRIKDKDRNKDKDQDKR